MTVYERFWAKVEKTEGCWLWRGALRDGYGSIRTDEPYRWVSAHRLAYEQLVGPIPDGLVLDHTCRQRACVRPDHLEPVTHRTNILRGSGWAAQNAAKETCPRGHPYDMVTQEGQRVDRRCSICWEAARRRARAKYLQAH